MQYRSCLPNARSETAFDWLANMQLWSAAGLGQVVKWLTPMGWVWSPILPDLVNLVHFTESQAISEASYYRVTTKFVNDVLAGYGATIIRTLNADATR